MISSVLHRNTQLGQDLAKREYWRNDRDQILAWKRGSGGPNAMENGRGNRYAYDEEGQLTSASYRVEDPAGAATGAMRADVFEYDKMGNRMGTHDLASRGSMNFTRDNNGLNQYSSWTPAAINQDDDMGGQWGTPGHANGVTMQEGWITASYNALNQPMAMWCPRYGSNFKWFGYDPLGRCVKRWDGPLVGTPLDQRAPPVNSNQATYYYYDGWNLVQEGPNGSTANRTYVHGGRVDEILASQVDGLWYYHHYDGQGNCILLSTTSGGLQEQYDYDAFGFPYFYNASGGIVSSPPRTRFLFTGREWLSDLRIYDYRARLYQPELGRFLQPDPKQFGAGDYNLYRYSHNDPVNKSDPFGLEDRVIITFEPAMGNMKPFWVTPAQMQSIGDSRSEAVTVVPKVGGITTTATVDPVTKDVTVNQKVQAVTLLPKSEEELGTKTALAKEEMSRIAGYRVATTNAGVAANELAAKGFNGDAEAAKRAVEASTRAILKAKTLEMRKQYDLNHGRK